MLSRLSKLAVCVSDSLSLVLTEDSKIKLVLEHGKCRRNNFKIFFEKLLLSFAFMTRWRSSSLRQTARGRENKRQRNYSKFRIGPTPERVSEREES